MSCHSNKMKDFFLIRSLFQGTFFLRPETSHESRKDLSSKFSDLILLKVIAPALGYLKPFHFLIKSSFIIVLKSMVK